MQNTYGKLLISGLDWLTMTWPHKSPVLKQAGEAVFERLGELEIEGWEMADRRAMQFQGWGSEKLAWLRSDTHVMLRASGYEANETAKRIIAAQASGNCTRIDTQCTADYNERELYFAERMRESLHQSPLRHKTHRREKSAHFKDRNGDTGLTFGDRSGEKYLRIYHAASGGHPELPDTAIRFEWEFKADRARQIWGMARAAASLEVVAASVVQGELMASGLREPWFGSDVPFQLPAIADIRSIAKTLQWYETQVVPSLKKHVTGEHQETIRRLFLDALYPSEISVKRRSELEVPRHKKIYLGE